MVILHSLRAGGISGLTLVVFANDFIIPGMNSNERPGKRARQSTAQSPPAGKARRARQSTAQPSPTGYFKRPKKKKKLQQNNNTASHSSASSSAPAAVQRAPVSQAGDNSQGRNRHWKRSPYQRGDPSPHKGSSSSSWKRK